MMKKTIYILIISLVFAVGCSKKDKKVIPFFSSLNETATTQGNAGVGVGSTGANTSGQNASVTASGATLTTITVTPAEQSIAKDTTATYTATGTYSDGTTREITNDCTWTVKEETDRISVVTSRRGRFLGTSATNSGRITASFETISGDASLRISNATLATIQVNSVPSLTPGGNTQYIATGVFSDGTTQDISDLVSWSSSDTNIVTVSATTGSATGGSTNGTATITASLTSPSTFPSVAAGTTNTQVSTTSTVATTTSTTTTSTVGGYNVTVPSGMATGTTPTGDFNGITYQGNPAEVAGFVSTVSYAGSGCSAFGTTLLGAMINDTPDKITINDQISASTVGTSPNCSSVYSLQVTVNANMTVTELSNHLIKQIGTAVPGGSVSNLPVNAGSESPTTTFRVILQATFSETGNELVGVGVSREADYANNASLLNSLLDGTNINPVGTTNSQKTDSFTASADPKVDFVWVVDNSSSMSAEQSKVQTNAATFFSKLSTKHLDFRLGVITTGSTQASSDNTKCTMTPSGHKAWDLWGTGWTSSTDGSQAFVDNVSTVGNAGCGSDETAPFFMERALGVHTGVAATVVPRTGAKLIFVTLTDEGDGYSTMAGKTGANAPSTTFSATSNIFVTNQYKVYSIIGIYDGSITVSGATIGQPGRCDSNTASSTAPKAASSNNDNGAKINYDLAAATGGSSSTICTNDYSAILDNIATQAAGNASTYVLSQTPISSTIAVKVNGTAVAQDATNGWQYNSASKTIVFSGTAWPAEGAAITVSYEYNSSVAALEKAKDSSLMAYISRASENGTAQGAAAAIAILVGAILAGRIWRRKN